ncbi:hypothetical protein QOU18_16045 [Pseudomonas aeruginosa]|uniref:hypothetical protein n=1 Tax=Pseudomonas aeruginosa TaxID=287 RepID=UPI002341EE45|nr:hypothetical protein [Pseudomonas aeruginosa]MDC3802198.1 hypothetical protein [Pseudomonas aeruginosa]
MNRFQAKEEFNSDCRFCGYMSQRKNDPINTPWMSSNKYSAFVSVGALVEGWSLIVPKKHVINLSSEFKNSEFWGFAAEAISAVQENYGSVSIFEHGAFRADSRTSCGTAHAHLHIVPLYFSLIEAAKEFNPEMEWEECRADEIAEKSRGQEYLFVSEDRQRDFPIGQICRLNEETSQFFRKVIAKKIGKPNEFDYKVFKMTEVANSSIKKLTDYCWKKNK